MNERVVKNPNFKDGREFHKSLAARGVGAKDYPNTHTEVEHLGNGKFAASIGVGHRVFFDKADGNKPKKHKLADERPEKDYVLIQGAKCCVEVYPYYAKYFDVQHEEVRLHEERWVVQRLFKEPDEWRDVDAYNPQMAVEEYPEPAGDVVKVTVTYDTDYGVLTVEYFQRDGNALKHNVSFKYTSPGEETFRVLQRWAGIVGDKCNGKDYPLVTDDGYLAFHNADKPKKQFTIAENLRSMMFNPDGSERTEKCLQRPIRVESHAQGMKADFIYGNWVLAQDESLEIDPDTATLDDPTEDGNVEEGTGSKVVHLITIGFGVFDLEGIDTNYRGYVEWDVSEIPDGSDVTDTVFKYEGKTHHASATDSDIKAIIDNQPSTHPSGGGAGQAIEVYTEIGTSAAYVANSATFPVVGANQSEDLGAAADTDLENQLVHDWFAIGFKTQETETPPGLTDWKHHIYSEDKTDAPTPKPTLYVEYTPPVVEKKHTFRLHPRPGHRMEFHPNLKLG